MSLCAVKVLAAPTSASNISKEKKVVVYGLDINNYERTLLEMALKLSYSGVQIAHYHDYLPRGREFYLMEKSAGIDVTWGSATKDREKRFKPIRVPIYKGLIGWRLALVTPENVDMLASVSNVEDFSQFTAGQNLLWTDTKILNANGIVTHSGNNKHVLAQMLSLKRFDYFPRSVVEIEKDTKELAEFNLVIDTHLLISYPTAYYFYVNKDNHQLASAIEKGLKAMHKSGAFNRLFSKYFAELLTRLNLNQRTQIVLNNPLLPATAPLMQSELWLNKNSIASILANNGNEVDQ